MTLALADQSSLPNIGPTWLWVILAAITLAALAKWIVDQITNAPTQDADVSHLDALDGVKPTKCCTIPFCDDPVQIHLHVGNDWWLFCMTHGLPYLTGQPYDQEAAS